MQKYTSGARARQRLANTVLAATLAVLVAGCGTEYIVAGAGALGAVVVNNAKKGAAAGTVAAAGYAGSADETTGKRRSGYGGSAQVSSQGIASSGGLGLAARSRFEIGSFGSDYLFGDLDLEVGGGMWLADRIGVGATAGWQYRGYFDTRNTVPIRAIVSAAVPHAFIYSSAHISWNADDWSSYGIDGNVVLRSDPGNALSIGVNFESQEHNARVFGITIGYGGVIRPTVAGAGVVRSPNASP